jgi:hypothetical protein
MKLFAPELYKALTPDGKADICNGCGAKGFGWLVPDTMWGLCVTAACDIHDFMYAVGETEADREEADRVLLNNLVRIINLESKWQTIRMFRLFRALIYFVMVRMFGGPAFWDGKNKPENELVV